MYRYRAFNLNFSSEVLLPECTDVKGEHYDFKIVRKNLSPPELEETNLYRKNTMARCKLETDGSIWLHWAGVATYHAVNGEVLEVDAETDDPEILSLFTVSEAIGLILFQKGYFLLHASAVQIGGRSWVFLGNPGAGKSTTCAAFVTAGCPLLSDDMTAIWFDSAGKPFVVPSYPQLKIWEGSAKGLGYQTEMLEQVVEGTNKFALHPRENFPDSAIPLDQFIFLYRDGQADEDLRPGSIPTELIRHFPLPNQLLNPSNLKFFFEQSMRCAGHVRARRIQRPENFGALNRWVNDCLAGKPLTCTQ